MPLIGKKGKIHKSELPRAVARSGKKARRVFAQAHDAAAERYGEGERALRVAFSALERSFEKVGKRWERRTDDGKTGRVTHEPAAPAAPATPRRTEERLDPGATKAHLYEVAQRLEIPRRSTMTKAELVAAIQQENRRRSRAVRA